MAKTIAAGVTENVNARCTGNDTGEWPISDDCKQIDELADAHTLDDVTLAPNKFHLT